MPTCCFSCVCICVLLFDFFLIDILLLKRLLTAVYMPLNIHKRLPIYYQGVSSFWPTDRVYTGCSGRGVLGMIVLELEGKVAGIWW